MNSPFSEPALSPSNNMGVIWDEMIIYLLGCQLRRVVWLEVRGDRLIAVLTGANFNTFP